MIFDTTIPHIGEFTKVPLNLLFAIGVCVLRWKPNEKPKALQVVFFLILIFHLIFDCGCMMRYLLLEDFASSLEKTAYIIYFSFAGNSVMKFFYCLYYAKKTANVLKKLARFYPKTLQERRDYQLDEHLKSIQKYNIGLTIYHFCVTSMFNLLPLVQNIVFYYENEGNVFLYELPFPMVYAFDSKTSLGYTFAYFTQCSGAYSASCAFLGFDLLLITCVHIINMNFKYLAKCIRGFRPTGCPSDMKQLKDFIIYHNHILECIEIVDEIFNISVFLNYLGTATILCLIGFQLVVGTEFLDLIKFLSFLISILTHVYFISIFGTEMMTLSSDISEAFMHHPWYEGNVQYQRAVLLPIAQAQKSVHLNAFKFFIISMETFKSLVSVSYQFFTLIKTSHDEH